MNKGKRGNLKKSESVKVQHGFCSNGTDRKDCNYNNCISCENLLVEDIFGRENFGSVLTLLQNSISKK